MSRRAVTALFTDRASAERAFQAALDLGFTKSDIDIVMSDETREKHFRLPDDRSKITAAAKSEGAEPTGSKLGGPMGGTAGTIAPIVAAVGVLLIPGIGWIAAGPAAIALAAAGAAGLAGGLVSLFADWGIADSRVQEYEAGIRAGGILLGLKPRSDEEASRVAAVWSTAGGQYVLGVPSG